MAPIGCLGLGRFGALLSGFSASRSRNGQQQRHRLCMEMPVLQVTEFPNYKGDLCLQAQPQEVFLLLSMPILDPQGIFNGESILQPSDVDDAEAFSHARVPVDCVESLCRVSQRQIPCHQHGWKPGPSGVTIFEARRPLTNSKDDADLWQMRYQEAVKQLTAWLPAGCKHYNQCNVTIA